MRNLLLQVENDLFQTVYRSDELSDLFIFFLRFISMIGMLTSIYKKLLGDLPLGFDLH